VLIKRVYQTVGSDDQDEMNMENKGMGEEP
jgi:hypothetical protein